MSATGSNEEKGSSLWSQLPSFDPSVDDVREFMQKARFLHGVFPDKEKKNLASRLAMLCKGTAWSQVRHLDPTKLVDPENGVKYLLDALSPWEETNELKTFELFEKALYKVTQRPDEAAHSYSLRMQAAFNDLGDQATIKEMQAFVLLRQSCLSNEDKKRVLAMSNGKLEVHPVEQAMRTLSTRVLLGSGEQKKKIYPTNYVEPEENHANNDDEVPLQSTYQVITEEEEALTAETIDQMAQAGDDDALTVQQFERDFEEMMQDIPDLQSALVSYQEARQRINDRRRSRGFWPSKGRSKGQGKDFHTGGRYGRKGGRKGGKEELLSRISRTHCKLCGVMGHWKAECPQRREQAREQANVVQIDGQQDEDLPQVIVEEMDEASSATCHVAECFHVQNFSLHPKQHSKGIPESVRVKAVQFMSRRLSSHWSHGKPMGINRGVNWGNKNKRGYKGRKNHRPSARKSWAEPMLPAVTSDATCLASQVCQKVQKETGLAIIDTAAKIA